MPQTTPDSELLSVFALFFNEPPASVEIKSTGRGESDFRENAIAEWKTGEKYVLKLADNDFTFPEKIEVWRRCAEEYRRLGYYCPAILRDKKGGFPVVEYRGRRCAAYAEEYSKYRPLDERADEGESGFRASEELMDEAFVMTARVAAQRFGFSAYPSGYCLFERFCPSDETDEVLETALEWKRCADTLDGFSQQAGRIWRRWTENRSALKRLYPSLPTSVFQADLNPTNLLTDESGRLVGLIDFNLCGRDVLLNYVFREICWFAESERELAFILRTLKNMSRVYAFTQDEITAAPLIYRCVKPLWQPRLDRLKSAGGDSEKISACLDEIEYMQTSAVDFALYMRGE